MVVVDNAAAAVDTPNSYPSSTTQSQTWTLLQHQDQGPHEEVKQLPSQAVQQAPNSNVEVQLEDVAAVDVVNDCDEVLVDLLLSLMVVHHGSIPSQNQVLLHEPN